MTQCTCELEDAEVPSEQTKRAFCDECPRYWNEQEQEKKMFMDDPRHWFCQWPLAPDEKTCRYHDAWLEKLDNERRERCDEAKLTEGDAV